MTNQNKELCTCEVPFEETTNFCHRCMKHIRKGQELSVCCNAEKRTTLSDEGTGYYQCATCGYPFIPRKPIDINLAKALIRHGKELETWEEEFDKKYNCDCFLCEQGGHEFSTTAKDMKDFISQVEAQAFERGQLKGEQNVSMEKRRCYKMGKEEAIEEIENWTCNNGISHKKSFVALIKFLETLKSKTP